MLPCEHGSEAFAYVGDNITSKVSALGVQVKEPSIELKLIVVVDKRRQLKSVVMWEKRVLVLLFKVQLH